MHSYLPYFVIFTLEIVCVGLSLVNVPLHDLDIKRLCNFVVTTTNTYSVSYFARVIVLSLLHWQLTIFRTVKFKIQFFILFKNRF